MRFVAITTVCVGLALLASSCASIGSVAMGDTTWPNVQAPAEPTNAPVAAQMVLIPAGPFVMGDTFNDGDVFEKPVHTNHVSAFWIDKCEVTYGQWKEVYDWALDHGYTFGRQGFGKTDNHPAWGMNWYDAVKWCNARSEKEGLEPCYYLNSWHWWGVYRSGQADIWSGCVKWDANGYRLPTEAAWEKAARGGATGTRFPWTGDNAAQHTRANYQSTSNCVYDTSATRGYHPVYSGGASPVGSFPTNGYGVCDMGGNMLEWCWDWFAEDYYRKSPKKDPTGPSDGQARVVRGGSWNQAAYPMRCASRSVGMPFYATYDNLGFRCVRRKSD